MLFKRFTIPFLTLLVMTPLAMASSQAVKIVGFGDSLMAGYNLGPQEGFVPRLQAALREAGIEAEIANAGVSGDTTSGGLARLDWSVPDGTDLVILELGANDALRGVSPQIVRANLDQMITALKARGIAVLLAGMLAPPNMGADYGAQFNAIYPELAASHDVPLYPFFLDGVAAQPTLLLGDGMHPNAAGIAEMVKRILPVVQASIEALAAD